MQGPQLRARPVLRQLPYALLATAAVVAAPPLAITMLFPGTTMVPAILLCGIATLALSRTGDLLWRRRPQSQDVLFGDLMLWGWARRMRTERALAREGTLFTADEEQLGVVSAERRLAGLERLTTMVEARDAYTHRHSLRVTRYAEGIARQLGLPEDEIARVRTAAALHDVGKYLTPREIINKPGKLTDEEFAVIKQHPGVGASLLAGLVDPQITAAVRHHHERLSGRGYPDGLAGEEIPLGARIIAVADTFDALTSTRSYRPARSHKQALAILQEERGTQLDAAAVDAFTTYYSGRRGVALSGLATAALVPLRDVAGPAVVRVLPGLGASVALTAPLLTASAPAVSADRPAAPQRHAVVAKAPPHRARHRLPAGMRVTAAVPHAQERHAGSGHRGARPVTTSKPSKPQHQSGTGQPSPATSHPTTAAPEATSAPATETTHDQGSSTPQTHTTTAPEPTAAPQQAAPTAAPEVAVDPVTVQAGGVTITTPDIDVDLPDLPIPVPTVHVELPDIHLP